MNLRKLGTTDYDIVETTPFVFKEKLILLETVPECYRRQDHAGERYLRCRDVESGRIYPAFGKRHSFAGAYTENGLVWVFAPNEGIAGAYHDSGGGKYIQVFRSEELHDWKEVGQFKLQNEGRAWNSSVCKAEGRYIMAYETDDPNYYPKFTIKFAESTDLVRWTKIPKAIQGEDRYEACPALRYYDGWFYNICLERRNSDPLFSEWYFEEIIARSRDLVHWQRSDKNPLLTPSPEDRLIYNPDVKLTGREVNINTSDIDFCEFQAKTHIFYAWGDQLGIHFLARAEYPGPEKEFLESYF